MARAATLVCGKPNASAASAREYSVASTNPACCDGRSFSSNAVSDCTDQTRHVLVGGNLLAQQPAGEHVVVEPKQGFEMLPVRFSKRMQTSSQKGVQQQIELAHATATLPLQAPQIVGDIVQIALRSIRFLMLPIARVGFSPLGHTSTQFMMV